MPSLRALLPALAILLLPASAHGQEPAPAAPARAEPSRVGGLYRFDGGGAQDRNFLWVAPFFADAGGAVLGCDKRGIGGSTGEWRSAVAADLAADAVAAVDFLRAQSKIDRGRVGLYGSGNGGWVAPIAVNLAARDARGARAAIAASAREEPDVPAIRR